MTEKIIKVLSGILKKTEAEILELDKKDGRYWDSLQMIEIVFCLEQEFGIIIDTDDISRMKSLKSIEEIIEKSSKN